MEEYQKLIQEALLGVVRKILQKTADEGLIFILPSKQRQVVFKFQAF